MDGRGKIPQKCDVVIIGGGPAGTTAAGLLARDGLEVVLFDKVTHERPQVGESVIPQMWKHADFLGVTPKLVGDGFLPKAGGIVVWDDKIQLMRFSEFGYAKRGGLHVERHRFDKILLDHARELGAQVFEEVIVRNAAFDGPDRTTVSFDDRRGGEDHPGSIDCRFVVDASGASAFLAKQFNSRKFVHTDMKFLGLWGYFTNSRYFGVDGKSYPAEKVREEPPVTLVLKYQDGWIWHIPLREVTSVGFVMNTDSTKGMNKAEQEKYFRETCRTVPYLREVLEGAKFVEGSMNFRPDYSYYSERVVGDNFFCAGDAAAFVDPIFSQGVLTAMYHAGMVHWAFRGILDNPSRRQFFLDLYKNRVLQYYGFSRLLAFGDFGGEGIDPVLVKQLVKSLPQNEVELAFAASWTTSRSDNLVRMLRDAGLDPDNFKAKVHVLDALRP